MRRSITSPILFTCNPCFPCHCYEANIYLEELLHQDPDNPDLFYNLGLCYVDFGQLDLT